MSQEDVDALKNASVIIERFGGIRPMAAKVGAPVTTVQGWKKRDVIPGARREDVLKAANENRIDLSDILTTVPEITIKNTDAPEKEFTPPGMPSASASASTGNDNVKITVEPLIRPQAKPLPSSLSPRIDTTHEELMAAIERGQKKAVRTSVWTTLVFVLLLGGAGALALLPSAQKIEKHEDQIADLEGKVGAIDKDVQAMNETAGSLRDLVPSEMRKTLSELKAEAQGIKGDIEKVAGDAKSLSSIALSSDAGSFSDRLSIIEAKLSDVEGGQAMKDLATRIKNLEVSLSGQQQLNDSMTELSKIVDSLDGQVNMLDDKLAQVQQVPGSALGSTLEGISDKDLKAAALLIAFSQLRESLNRDAPFADDVALLQKLVGKDDPELQVALTRLAPQAEKGGVLTSAGLSNEFKGLAGDIVFSSLAGEDVSMADKAKVRLTQVLNVKKDGELVGGTPTQKAVAKAQDQLDAGDVQGAIATLKTLDGDAATKVAPFIEQAQATVLADQIQSMLRQTIISNVGSNLGTAAGAPIAAPSIGTAIQNAMPGSGVVKDDASGMAILPAPKGFKGFSSGTPE
ncbi:MAG: hypothetical protein DI551_07900 [Micavibrio aeruginosavorus]|uniref:Uncharacterized protein n=1 Tax=Micavibrio aeruginosavorus TaxID=349221 RepID=A0A2W5Q1Q4_9BACT|nr:MAG: hypothetical protein DI551_07900 [Micavibrio aeruginosavorus]